MCQCPPKFKYNLSPLVLKNDTVFVVGEPSLLLMATVGWRSLTDCQESCRCSYDDFSEGGEIYVRTLYESWS